MRASCAGVSSGKASLVRDSVWSWGGRGTVEEVIGFLLSTSDDAPRIAHTPPRGPPPGRHYEMSMIIIVSVLDLSAPGPHLSSLRSSARRSREISSGAVERDSGRGFMGCGGRHARSQ